MISRLYSIFSPDPFQSTVDNVTSQLGFDIMFKQNQFISKFIVPCETEGMATLKVALMSILNKHLSGEKKLYVNAGLRIKDAIDVTLLSHLFKLSGVVTEHNEIVAADYIESCLGIGKFVYRLPNIMQDQALLESALQPALIKIKEILSQESKIEEQAMADAFSTSRLPTFKGRS